MKNTSHTHLRNIKQIIAYLQQILRKTNLINFALISRMILFVWSIDSSLRGYKSNRTFFFYLKMFFHVSVDVERLFEIM